ncbi:MAG: hypothetical protein GY913_10340, partial [Proteobacteria bacterium]|nr:hypothetical protein [Pseudomonadota bacterium]
LGTTMLDRSSRCGLLCARTADCTFSEETCPATCEADATPLITDCIAGCEAGPGLDGEACGPRTCEETVELLRGASEDYRRFCDGPEPGCGLDVEAIYEGTPDDNGCIESCAALIDCLYNSGECPGICDLDPAEHIPPCAPPCQGSLFPGDPSGERLTCEEMLEIIGEQKQGQPLCPP